MNEMVLSDFYRAAELMTNGWSLSQITLYNDEFYPQSPEVWIRLVPKKYKQLNIKKTVKQNRVYLFNKIKKLDTCAKLFRFADNNEVIESNLS